MIRRIRLLQIRSMVFLLTVASQTRPGLAMIRSVRAVTLLNAIFGWLLGYASVFSSFAEAQACARKFSAQGHEHPAEIQWHKASSQTTRESDYPVLFYLSSLPRERIRRVFDLGGNVGNLFYAYNRHLLFSKDMVWMIHDLPEKKSLPLAYATQQKESRIVFADSFESAASADLLLASGCVHYFEKPLDEMIRALAQFPAYVIVNRAPFSDGFPLITVQDNGSYLVPCKLHSKPSFLSGMAGLGYRLRDSWLVHERKLRVPLYPERSSQTYFGFFFELEKL